MTACLFICLLLMAKIVGRTDIYTKLKADAGAMHSQVASKNAAPALPGPMREIDADQTLIFMFVSEHVGVDVSSTVQNKGRYLCIAMTCRCLLRMTTLLRKENSWACSDLRITFAHILLTLVEKLQPNAAAGNTSHSAPNESFLRCP